MGSYLQLKNFTDKNIYSYFSLINFSFKHNYDGLSRLTAVTNLNGIFSETYNYDSDGNFTSKSRAGNTVSYSYGGNNRLNSVSINGGSALNYTYDARGNLLTDTRRSTSFSQYDHRNLPLSTTSWGVTKNYYYDDMGNRIAKFNNNTEFYLRDHTGRELAIFKLESTGREFQMANIYGNGLIGRVDATYSNEIVGYDPDTGEPIWVWTRSDNRKYYIKDHLGSIRQTFDKDGAITNAQDYYPFGETIRSVTGNLYRDKYKFTEKERDTETGYDYFGARYYDSYIGRWLSVDPLADKYPGWSPYIQCSSRLL
jgi:RHS repeat-associated protein